MHISSVLATLQHRALRLLLLRARLLLTIRAAQPPQLGFHDASLESLDLSQVAMSATSSSRSRTQEKAQLQDLNDVSPASSSACTSWSSRTRSRKPSCWCCARSTRSPPLPGALRAGDPAIIWQRKTPPTRSRHSGVSARLEETLRNLQARYEEGGAEP